MARTRCPSPESCWPAARRPISETCPPGEGALLCSWDGPLDCQAPGGGRPRWAGTAPTLVRPSATVRVRPRAGAAGVT